MCAELVPDIQALCGGGACAVVELIESEKDGAAATIVRVSNNREPGAAARTFTVERWEEACSGIADKTMSFGDIFPMAENVPTMDNAERAALEARMEDGSMSADNLRLAMPAGIIALSAEYRISAA